MQLFKSYHDMNLEIEILEDELKNTEREIEQWWVGGRLFPTVRIDQAAERVQKLKDKQIVLSEELKHKLISKDKFEERLNNMEGIAYKVFYGRYVEGKLLTEIADDLGYSYQYIKKVSQHLKLKELAK